MFEWDRLEEREGEEGGIVVLADGVNELMMK